MYRPAHFILNPIHPETRSVRLALFGRGCVGTLVQDSSQFGFHGTLTNATTYGTDADIHRPAFTLAATLDTSPEHVSVPFDSSIISGTKWSCAWWQNTTDNASYSSEAAVFGSGTYGRITTNLDTSVPGTPWYGYTTMAQRLLVRVSSSAYIEYRPVGQRDGAWHHIAIVRDGTTVRYYYDGEWHRTLIDQTATAFPWENTLYIGCQSPISAANQFNGSIADFLLVDGLLTSNTIRGLADYDDPMCRGFLSVPAVDEFLTFSDTPTPTYSHTVMSAGGVYLAIRTEVVI